MKIETIIKKEACILVRKCIDKKLNNCIFDNYFDKLSHNKGTRNNNVSLKLTSVKLVVAKQCFFFSGAKLYDDLSLKTRLINDFNKFRTTVSSNNIG